MPGGVVDHICPSLRVRVAAQRIGAGRLHVHVIRSLSILSIYLYLSVSPAEKEHLAAARRL